MANKPNDVLKVKNADGKELEVTRKAYDVVYKSQGYALVDREEQQNEQNENEQPSFSMENKKDELTAELDRLGVEYDPKDNKETLLGLIEGAAE
jgi:hypothetical protein